MDPQWAWSAYEPDSQRPWDRALAAHLFRRAGFAANHRQLEEATLQDPQAVARQLVVGPRDFDDFCEESDTFAETILATGDPKQLSAWWVYTLLRTPHPLLEQLTLFWHGHFATSADKVQEAGAMYAQNRLLRQYALGDFAQLTHEISRDPAMLLYLDSATNRKAHPNENFARELMELFCLGEGNYTERDIQELARCFTGWEIRRGRFRFNRYQHDFGEKTIFGNKNVFPDESAIDLVLQQPSGPRFIARKLVRYFVYDEAAITDAMIEPLVRQLRSEDWNIAPVVQRILTSNLFFSPHALGRKVRSPVDLTVGLLRSLEGSTNAHRLAAELTELGQGLFYPPNVKGWDGGRTWINASTLLGRANVMGRLLRDESTRFGGSDLATYLEQQRAHSAAEIVDTLVDLTMAVQPANELRRRLVSVIESGSGDRNERVVKMVHVMSTLPEFQLG